MMWSRQSVVTGVLLLLLVVAVVLASACAIRGGEFNTPPANLANGYVVLSEVRLMAAEAVKQKQITPANARRVLELTDVARTTLDQARDLHFSGSKDAVEKGMVMVEALLGQARALIEVAVINSQKAKESK